MRRALANIKKTESIETIMHLSYTAATNLNLRIATTSGQGWSVDWGDGVWEDYPSSDSTNINKPFGEATSGVARIKAVNGLEDIYYFRSTTADWDFTNISKLTSLTYLWLVNNLATGDLSGVVDLALLTTFVAIGDFTIDYTPKVFAPNFERWTFRPTTATNPMSSTELDQMLIDASQTTWTGDKRIDVDGNNGVRTSASDAAVATLQGMGVSLTLNT